MDPIWTRSLVHARPCLCSTPLPMDTRRHAGVLVVTVVAAVQVAILGFTSTENNRTGPAPVMCLPLASPWICTASVPGQLFATAFAFATRQIECPLDFVCCKLVIVCHRLFLLGASSPSPHGRLATAAKRDAPFQFLPGHDGCQSERSGH